jgi:tripartite ATP-independent transporter DctP family solute receptor
MAVGRDGLLKGPKPAQARGISRRTAALSALSAFAMAGCQRTGNRMLLSSDTHPAGYPTVEAVTEMGRLLEARTGGRLDIRVYAGGQLGAERDTLEITTFGGLDMNRVFLSPLNAIEPDTMIPSLPFLFHSREHMRTALDGAPGRAILNTLEKHGLIGLCFYDSGERSFYNTRRPIYTPADMKGMKIRTPNSDMSVAMINATGANATPMDLGEVYQSLVQGVIDGAENNWPSYESGRHFEAAPYFSLTRHVMTPEVLLMAKARWDKLSPADRDLVMACAQESVPFMRKLWDERVDGARQRLLANGVKENEVTDRESFLRLMKPVYDQFVVTPFQKRLVSEIEAMAI